LAKEPEHIANLNQDFKMSDNIEILATGLLGRDQEGPNSSYEDEYYNLIHTQFVCEFVHKGRLKEGVGVYDDA
jgi:hypothetical protein